MGGYGGVVFYGAKIYEKYEGQLDPLWDKLDLVELYMSSKHNDVFLIISETKIYDYDSPVKIKEVRYMNELIMAAADKYKLYIDDPSWWLVRDEIY